LALLPQELFTKATETLYIANYVFGFMCDLMSVSCLNSCWRWCM